MKTNIIYVEWTSSINLAKTRIVRFPSYIFLCGGPISSNQKNFLSCRDLFYFYTKQNSCPFGKSIILAEEVFQYFEHSSYNDLLRFERDLAELSVLTVLFSESPGSLAELGSFAVLKTIQDRLLVVMHEDDTHKESFIWRGPVLYLKDLAKTNGKEDPITIYNWPKKDAKTDFFSVKDFSDADDLAEVIRNLISKKPKTELFNMLQLGHIMLLMLDLLKVVQLATLEEIVFLLKNLGIDQHRTTIVQHLSLLKSLDLVVRKPYRNLVYYLATPQNDRLSWAYEKKATIRDLERWKARFVEFYSENQKEKLRALQSYLRYTRQIGDSA